MLKLDVMLKLETDDGVITWILTDMDSAMRIQKSTVGYYGDYDTIQTILDDLSDDNDPYIEYIDDQLIDVISEELYSYSYTDSQINQVISLIDEYKR